MENTSRKRYEEVINPEKEYRDRILITNPFDGDIETHKKRACTIY